MRINFNEKEYITPDSWNACTLKQAAFLYGIIMRDADPRLVMEEVAPAKRIEILKALTGWDQSFLEAWEADCIADNGPQDGRDLFLLELDQVCRQVSEPFLETQESGGVTLRFSLTRNPWPVLEDNTKTKTANKRPRRFYGPADELENLTLYELSVVFTMLENYLAAPNDDTINLLLANVYRQSKPATQHNLDRNYQGDRRLPFDEYEAVAPLYLKKMAGLPPIARQLLLFFLLSCRYQIVNSWPNLFKPPGENTGEKIGNDYGYGGVIMALAGDLTRIPETGRQTWRNAFTYMGYLEDQRKAREMKAALR